MTQQFGWTTKGSTSYSYKKATIPFCSLAHACVFTTGGARARKLINVIGTTAPHRRQKRKCDKYSSVNLVSRDKQQGSSRLAIQIIDRDSRNRLTRQGRRFPSSTRREGERERETPRDNPFPSPRVDFLTTPLYAVEEEKTRASTRQSTFPGTPCNRAGAWRRWSDGKKRGTPTRARMAANRFSYARDSTTASRARERGRSRGIKCASRL